jgi:hypothetical protein
MFDAQLHQILVNLSLTWTPDLNRTPAQQDKPLHSICSGNGYECFHPHVQIVCWWSNEVGCFECRRLQYAFVRGLVQPVEMRLLIWQGVILGAGSYHERNVGFM